MPGLTIIVATADPDRFHAALSVAAANAALGERSRIFLQGEATALLRDASSPADTERTRHGVPTVSQLLDEARALDVEIIACQSGLALCGLSAIGLPEGVTTAGIVQILSTLGDNQLVIV
jgi:predicted peroxiredoxin